MEILLQTPGLHTDIDAVQTPSSETVHSSSKKDRHASFSATRDQTISWGRRHHHGSWGHSLGCASIMLLCPLIVVFWYIALTQFDGSVWDALRFMLEHSATTFYSMYAPKPDLAITLGYSAWVLFQAVLYKFLPSVLSTGQLTPAGHLLKYRTNGLPAWMVTHMLFVAAVLTGVVDPAILAEHWGGLLVLANIFGFLITGFAYIKAHWSPTHEGDRKFSGSVIYDMYMGIELNPRFGEYFDFKLFANGRPGIIAWTLIDLSFIAYQYQLHGRVTYSIFVSTALHTLYVVDFFYNEDWYLRTIDICHDHFGFYLAWGSFVWLPAMYTLQTQFLARNPVDLSGFHALAILVTGVIGYIIFRSVNHQKNLFRRTNGNCKIWGSPAQFVPVKYHTKDGLEHNNILLCSGWWGLSRHMNYVGDLILSYSMCAACGFTHLLPWTYAIFMTVLLVHRCWRDEERCFKKYDKGWKEYTEKVRFAMIPGVW